MDIIVAPVPRFAQLNGPPRSLTRRMKPLSILVADDEENIRVLLEELLAAAGHKVVTVRNGTQGIAALKGHRFDLVLTDVLMADGDGLSLIAETKKSHSAARIIAISGGGRYLDGKDCLKMARGLGAHGALMKPFGSEQLMAAIKQVFPRPGSGRA
jgi:CheY-like chemotaxis protein